MGLVPIAACDEVAADNVGHPTREHRQTDRAIEREAATFAIGAVFVPSDDEIAVHLAVLEVVGNGGCVFDDVLLQVIPLGLAEWKDRSRAFQPEAANATSAHFLPPFPPLDPLEPPDLPLDDEPDDLPDDEDLDDDPPTLPPSGPTALSRSPKPANEPERSE